MGVGSNAADNLDAYTRMFCNCLCALCKHNRTANYLLCDACSAPMCGQCCNQPGNVHDLGDLGDYCNACATVERQEFPGTHERGCSYFGLEGKADPKRWGWLRERVSLTSGVCA